MKTYRAQFKFEQTSKKNEIVWDPRVEICIFTRPFEISSLLKGDPNHLAFCNQAINRHIFTLIGDGQKQFLTMRKFPQNSLGAVNKPTSMELLIASIKEENLGKPNQGSQKIVMDAHTN